MGNASLFSCHFSPLRAIFLMGENGGKVGEMGGNGGKLGEMGEGDGGDWGIINRSGWKM